jgi:hypothetical protein
MGTRLQGKIRCSPVSSFLRLYEPLPARQASLGTFLLSRCNVKVQYKAEAANLSFPPVPAPPYSGADAALAKRLVALSSLLKVEEDVAVEAQEEEEVETAKRTRRGEGVLTLAVLRERRKLCGTAEEVVSLLSLRNPAIKRTRAFEGGKGKCEKDDAELPTLEYRDGERRRG